MADAADPTPTPSVSEASEEFFTSLPEVTAFEGVFDRSRYADAPASWYVVITDVIGSTQAIERGRYREVNALGVASIIAVRNAAPDLQLPFVFGGDGATMLVPGSRLAAIDGALRGLRSHATSAFDLGLRVARVPVAELRREGHAVRVERYRLSPGVSLGMFSGSGISAAEQWVKDPVRGSKYAVTEGPTDFDLDGFQCRWEPMPTQQGVILSLLVVASARDEQAQAATYRRVLEKINEIVGSGNPSPVSLRAMQLKGLRGDYSIEARLRGGVAGSEPYERVRRSARKETAVARVSSLLGVSIGGFDGSAYREEFVQNSDFRKFDETLRMVLDLGAEQVAALETWLEHERGAGALAYGTHHSDAALATCMVKAYQGDHLHFIDGSDGGYALAAKGLKAQLAALK